MSWSGSSATAAQLSVFVSAQSPLEQTAESGSPSALSAGFMSFLALFCLLLLISERIAAPLAESCLCFFMPAVFLFVNLPPGPGWERNHKMVMLWDPRVFTECLCGRQPDPVRVVQFSAENRS